MINNKVLTDYQDFLLSRGLVQEKYVSYYAHWASRYLAFSNRNENLSADLKIEAFINDLKKQNKITDWQVRQADDAVRLYTGNYLDAKSSKHASDVAGQNKKHPDVAVVLDNMSKAIRIRHYAYKTERTYVSWSKSFYDYLLKIKKKDIYELGVDSEDARDYLSYLALQRKVAASTQNQAFNSILFLFRNVLKVDLKDLRKTVRAKRGTKLPVVFTVSEVQKLFDNVAGVKQLILKLIYGAGLRLMEALRLRVKNIDFEAGLLFVRSGKGDKDRSTILPEHLKQPLREHLKAVKALHEQDIQSGYGKVNLPDSPGRKYPKAAKEWGWQYVFPASGLSVDPEDGEVKRYHLHSRLLQNAVKEALKKAGIVKHASVHTLRHSFATHLLMSGVNIREIQTLMGHRNVETTMIYTHVIRDITKAPQSPLDRLYKDKE
jgi:integron integrase